MKLRAGYISNSSTCSFIVCRDVITEEQFNKIVDWYAQKLEDKVYMDDMSSEMIVRPKYFMCTIAYVKDEFLSFIKGLGIEKEQFFLLEQ